MDIREIYDTITSIECIEMIRDGYKNENKDGESDTFELKGVSDIYDINKNDRSNISTEISAFANTYGGILVIHKSSNSNNNSSSNNKTELLYFSKDKDIDIEPIKQSISAIATKPPLKGMLMKPVYNASKTESALVVYVPEGTSKPYMADDGKYYYRSNTSSKPMEEGMIRALCREQKYLDIDISAIEINKIQEIITHRIIILYTYLINISISIKNNSSCIGTMPRLIISIPMYWHTDLSDNSNFKFKCLNKIDGYMSLTTTKQWSDNHILYPYDTLTIVENIKFDKIPDGTYTIYVDCVFKECKEVRYETTITVENGQIGGIQHPTRIDTEED